MSGIDEIGCFRAILDPYNGITIEVNSLPDTKEEFASNLDLLLEETKNTRNLIWIYIDISKSDFIPCATKQGFFFHTCEEDYILLVKKIKVNAILPTAANHTLGVGAVVLNDKNEILVIKEKISNLGFKLPGGHIDNAEMISQACKREVYEETGIDVEFESIVSIGHFYPHQFRQSNLYVICLAKPLSSEINIQDTQEIIDAKWIDVNKYLEDENVLEYSKFLVKSALKQKGFSLDKTGILSHINKDVEVFS